MTHTWTLVATLTAVLVNFGHGVIKSFALKLDSPAAKLGSGKNEVVPTLIAATGCDGEMFDYGVLE